MPKITLHGGPSYVEGEEPPVTEIEEKPVVRARVKDEPVSSPSMPRSTHSDQNDDEGSSPVTSKPVTHGSTQAPVSARRRTS